MSLRPRDVGPIAGLLRARREALGLSQADVASAVSALDQPTVTGGEVARWERGKRIPRRRARSALAQALDLPTRLLDQAAAEQRESRKQGRSSQILQEPQTGLGHATGAGDAAAAVEVGLLLRRLRCAKGWRQADLAVALSYSEPTISRMESGQRALSAADIDAMARVLEPAPADAAALATLVASAALETSSLDAETLFRSGDVLDLGRDLVDRAVWYRLGLNHGELLRLGGSITPVVDQLAALAGPSKRGRFEVLGTELRLEMAKAALEYYDKPQAGVIADALSGASARVDDSGGWLKAGMVREGVLYSKDLHHDAVRLCRDLGDVGLAAGGYWEMERARALLISSAESGPVTEADRHRVRVLAETADDPADRVFLLEGLAREAATAPNNASQAAEMLWAETTANLPHLMAHAPARLAQVLRTIAAYDDGIVHRDHLVRQFVRTALARDGNARYQLEPAD